MSKRKRGSCIDLYFSKKISTGPAETSGEAQASTKPVASAQSETQQVIAKGSFHQASGIFNLMGGSQCMANCLIAVAWTHVKECSKWTTDDLDGILRAGDTLYSNIYSKKKPGSHPYLFATDLPKSMKLHGCEYEVNVADSILGILSIDETVDSSYVTVTSMLSIEDAIEQFVKEEFTPNDLHLSELKSGSRSCIVILHEYSVAIHHLQDSKTFFVFDSHSRGEDGLFSLSGTSVMTKFNSIRDLCNFMRNLALSLSLKLTSQFELYPLVLISSAKATEQQLNSDLNNEYHQRDYADVEVRQSAIQYTPAQEEHSQTASPTTQRPASTQEAAHVASRGCDIDLAVGNETHNQTSNTTEKYQPSPDIIPPQVLKGKSLKFQASWFKLFPWIHYSVDLKAVVCFTCSRTRITTSDLHCERAFVSAGFKNWKKAKEKFAEHEASQYHLCAVETSTGRVSLLSSVDKAKGVKVQHQALARRMLLKIVSSLRYLSRQGLACRGHEADDGNFRQLLNLRQQDSHELLNWMSRTRTFTSSDIQNEILQLMAHNVIRNLTADIRISGSFSIIVDGTQDINRIEQESICVRYVDSELKPKEMFIGLYAAGSTTGDSLAHLILDALLRIDLPHAMLRGQAYDGASNMSGVYKGVQAIIKQQCPLAPYVHCGSHCTNLVAQDACEASAVVRDTLSVVNDLGVLMHQSGKSKANLLSAVTSHQPGSSIESIRPLCPTRWTVRVIAMKTVLTNLRSVLMALDEIARTFHGDTATHARGLLGKLSCGNSILAVHIALTVFEPLEDLCKTLQGRSQTVSGMKAAVDTVIKFLTSIRNEEAFTTVFTTASAVVLDHELEEISIPRVRKLPRRLDSGAAQHEHVVPESYYRIEYYKVIDSAVMQLNERFNQPGIQQLISLEKCLLNNDMTCDYSPLQLYPEIDVGKFCIQIRMFHSEHTFSTTEQAATILSRLQPESRWMFRYVEILVRLLLVVPASSAEAERSFSTLRRLKTWLRATMSQARLNHICILNIHDELVDAIDLEDVVDQFVSKNPSRADVFGIR